jgi:hypothetical protein
MKHGSYSRLAAFSAAQETETVAETIHETCWKNLVSDKGAKLHSHESDTRKIIEL